MARYLLTRIALMAPTLFGVLTITFVIIQFVPGGPVEQLVAELTHGEGIGEAASGAGGGFYRGGRGLDEEQLAAIRELYGFDKGPLERYLDMLARFLVFDLGESYRYHSSVTELIVERLPVSMSLGLFSFFLTYLICVPLGVAKAVRRGTRFDAISSVIVLVSYSIPSFVLGLFLLVLFGGGSFFDVFPLRGLVSDNWDDLGPLDKALDYLWHIFLPVLSISVSGFAVLTLLTKNSVLEEINRQYVLTALAKGLSERRTMYRHVLRNSLIPIITTFPTHFVFAFFSGSLLVETIFSLDGLGLLGYTSVVQRDYPVILGTLYVFTLLGMLAKLLTDMCYVWVDPRIKFTQVDS